MLPKGARIAVPLKNATLHFISCKKLKGVAHKLAIDSEAKILNR